MTEPSNTPQGRDMSMMYLKAVVGAAVAGLSSVATALDEGGITAQEWLLAVVATLTALGAVWAVPNRTSP